MLVRWHAVKKVVETDDFFLFFTTPSCAIQLPRRAISPPEAVEEIRQLVRRAAPDASLVLRA
jgi:hypothetical protein